MADVGGRRRPVDGDRRGGGCGGGERGVSTILGYTLNLAVATILVTGLLTAAGGYVEGQQERAIRTELDVIGSRVAGDIGAADRLVRTGGDTTVELEVSTPTRTTGVPYTIDVNTTGSDTITLSTTDPAVSVTVPFRTHTPVEAESVSGGTFTIRYDPSTGTLVIENA